MTHRIVYFVSCSDLQMIITDNGEFRRTHIICDGFQNHPIESLKRDDAWVKTDDSVFEIITDCHGKIINCAVGYFFNE